MSTMKRLLALVVALAAMSVLGCSGGGSGGGTTPTSMKEVTPPANAGTVGGFVYASTQQVAVDIAVPAANTVVTVYDKRPANSVYNAAGNPSTSLVTVAAPVQLAKGLSSATPDAANRYHFTTTITVPTAATSVYVTANVTAVVAITAKKVTATFDQGGII